MRPIGRQLRADGIEKGAELAELVVLTEIEAHAQFAATEAREAAANDVNRSQQKLREEHRAHDRDGERDTGHHDGGAKRGVQILPDQQRRHPDANRSEIGVAEPQRLPEFEILSLPRVDRLQLRQRRSREQLGEVAARRQHLAFARRIGMRDGEAFDVHERGVGDVLRIEARFENRPEARILVQCVVRGGGVGVGAHHFLCAMKDGVRDQLRARAAVLEADARQTREVQKAQEDDDRADDRRDAENLLPFDGS